jgi:2,3-bisphosphoglycerate-independent phosphoglycerate mutase
MDPVTLGIAAATVLATKAAEGFASQAGADAWGVVRRLHGYLRQRLSGKAAGALEQLEGSGSNPYAASMVATAVQDLAAQDQDFKTQVETFLSEASRSPQVATIIAEARDNAKQVNVTGDHFGTINM